MESSFSLINPYKLIPDKFRIKGAEDRLYDNGITSIRYSSFVANKKIKSQSHKLLRFLIYAVAMMYLIKYYYAALMRKNEEVYDVLAS